MPSKARAARIWAAVIMRYTCFCKEEASFLIIDILKIICQASIWIYKTSMAPNLRTWLCVRGQISGYPIDKEGDGKDDDHSDAQRYELTADSLGVPGVGALILGRH